MRIFICFPTIFLSICAFFDFKPIFAYDPLEFFGYLIECDPKAKILTKVRNDFSEGVEVSQNDAKELAKYLSSEKGNKTFGEVILSEASKYDKKMNNESAQNAKTPGKATENAKKDQKAQVKTKTAPHRAIISETSLMASPKRIGEALGRLKNLLSKGDDDIWALMVKLSKMYEQYEEMCKEIAAETIMNPKKQQKVREKCLRQHPLIMLIDLFKEHLEIADNISSKIRKKRTQMRKSLQIIAKIFAEYYEEEWEKLKKEIANIRLEELEKLTEKMDQFGKKFWEEIQKGEKRNE
ncbi:hypothetical protein niasHT_020806 [Heterodera trifolii]|uniref:Secretory protein n=1 Tax=Heterodera trifolii TaxID=157864 RepID=A0ABD2KFA9_9BILA